MRFLDMWNPFTIVGRDIASEERIGETLRELYNSQPHVMATLGFALASLSAALSGAVWPGVAATLVAIVCLLFRVLIERLFVARRTPQLHPKWIRLFAAGSLLSGFGSGLSAAILLYGAPPATQALTVAVACAIVQGAAGRAYMVPGTAFFNLAFIIGQMSLAMLALGNVIATLAGLLYFAFLTTFIVQMVRNRLRQLRAEQKADQLLRELTEKNELLKAANQALATKAHEDPLTGLANRRKFDLVFDERLETARRVGAPIALMMIDVDHFKAFNDTYGHQAGDECLQALSRAIADALSGDERLLARYGGEEFVALLPGEDEARALAAAERVRLAIRLTALDDLPNSPPRQTASIGLVAWTTGPDTTREAMLAAADKALYQAKKQGRNRVCLHAGSPDAALKAAAS